MEERNKSTRRQRAELADRKAETSITDEKVYQVGVNPNGKPKYRKVTTLSNGNKYSIPCEKPLNTNRRVAI
jgi:hypothetical protein